MSNETAGPEITPWVPHTPSTTQWHRATGNFYVATAVGWDGKPILLWEPATRADDSETAGVASASTSPGPPAGGRPSQAPHETADPMQTQPADASASRVPADASASRVPADASTSQVPADVQLVRALSALFGSDFPFEFTGVSDSPTSSVTAEATAMEALPGESNGPQQLPTPPTEQSRDARRETMVKRTIECLEDMFPDEEVTAGRVYTVECTVRLFRRDFDPRDRRHVVWKLRTSPTTDPQIRAALGGKRLSVMPPQANLSRLHPPSAPSASRQDRGVLPVDLHPQPLPSTFWFLVRGDVYVAAAVAWDGTPELLWARVPGESTVQVSSGEGQPSAAPSATFAPTVEADNASTVQPASPSREPLTDQQGVAAGSPPDFGLPPPLRMPEDLPTSSAGGQNVLAVDANRPIRRKRLTQSTLDRIEALLTTHEVEGGQFYTLEVEFADS
ncbi:hypothetical protein AURDEDRAFT_131194 [Auricularia subglabra TFB-10046 SS5]|uniref:Uncharacterized protein n=1 Tax=Auricularia subglabra (strain TFB-10046 / SS5) TaxID=717982 RepID=J0D6B4_AURST|nr:hypothetical protein AURDEDRAFT_131194 [Auricularia subglabra TFB-10046 SS5]